MKTLGLIPARGGSKRIRRKNLQMLGNRTLVARAIEVGQKAACLSRVVVSSEDPEILAEARRHGDDIAVERPPEYATDTSPVIECLRYTLDLLESAGDPRYDAVVILHPTSPLRLPEDIDATVALMRKTGAPSAVSVVQVNHMIHPFKLKVMSGDRLDPYIEPERGRRMAHELPKIFVRNCAVYAATRSLIDKNLLIDEENCVGYVMPSERSVDINESLDLDLAELILSRRDADKLS